MLSRPIQGNEGPGGPRARSDAKAIRFAHPSEAAIYRLAITEQWLGYEHHENYQENQQYEENLQYQPLIRRYTI